LLLRLSPPLEEWCLYVGLREHPTLSGAGEHYRMKGYGLIARLRQRSRVSLRPELVERLYEKWSRGGDPLL
jgi:hypothetical protein